MPLCDIVREDSAVCIDHIGLRTGATKRGSRVNQLVKQQKSPTVWEGVLDKTEYIITSTRILQRRDVHQISAQQNAAILLNLVLELLSSDTTSTTILKTPPPPLLKKKISPWNLENSQMFSQKHKMNLIELDV